ncbi:plasmid mobilization protein [Pedobacter foliorum]|uniref:plasmid mobilization protein n=1 Tax=Pedobacter foliorum TaxID=2739058 RepID=UPI0015646FA7|nr:plasmid mobilization relaxosome protein MobC [Pedobacter foliorum]NRF37563.1 plasmid mobilization relaxosome protein MobC [Pedobacter foliorum]
MEEKYKWLKGRPPLKNGKRNRMIKVYFTEEEFALVRELVLALGIKRTEFVRMRVLQGSSQIMFSAKELMVQLDLLGAELARSGNNINQLARYANVLNKRTLLSPQIIERYNVLLAEYLKIQQRLETTLRKLIRSMTK